MNQIDLYVTEILSKPYQSSTPDSKWWHIDVMANCHGSIQKTTISVDSKEKAELIEIGYRFLG